MDSLQKISNDLVQSINEKEKKKSIPYDTYAKVIRIDGGTAWVHIPGGVDETPVALTVNAKVGDSVLVRVSGGNAWIVGNSSAPPTDDTKAVEAKGVADVAQVKAANAQETAESAEEIAKDASRAVKSTSQYFWHTETDTGAGAGAHITEVPQEDFIADPANGGGNLLAQSRGIAIRDGVIELATFGASTQIGQKANRKSRLRLSDDALQIVYHANDSDYVVGELSTRGLVLDGHDSSIGATKYKEESFTLPHNSQTNGTTATRLKLGMGVWIITAWAQFDESSTGRRWLAIRDLTYGYTEQEVNQMAVKNTPTRMMTTFIADVGTDGTNDSITYCPRVYQNSGLGLLTDLKISAVRIV